MWCLLFFESRHIFTKNKLSHIYGFERLIQMLTLKKSKPLLCFKTSIMQENRGLVQGMIKQRSGWKKRKRKRERESGCLNDITGKML